MSQIGNVRWMKPVKFETGIHIDPIELTLPQLRYMQSLLDQQMRLLYGEESGAVILEGGVLGDAGISRPIAFTHSYVAQKNYFLVIYNKEPKDPIDA